MIEQLVYLAIGFFIGIMIPIRRFASYHKSYRRHNEKEYQEAKKEFQRETMKGQVIKLKSDLEKDIEEITKT